MVSVKRCKLATVEMLMAGTTTKIFSCSTYKEIAETTTLVFDSTVHRSWRRGILRALSMKNKVRFITEKCKKPNAGEATYDQWARCDDMMTSWIMNSLSKNLADSLQYVNDAKELWKELEERYDQTNGEKLYQLQKEMNDLNQITLDITRYYTKIKKLWEELNTLNAHAQCDCQCTCGAKANMHKAEQDRRLIQFLIGLNKVYIVIRGSILMMNPLPSIAHAFSILIQEEKHREVRPRSAANVHGQCEEMQACNSGDADDSAASNHMTYRKSVLTNIRTLPYPFLVTLPNGYRVKVTEIGDVFLSHRLTMATSMKRPLEIVCLIPDNNASKKKDQAHPFHSSSTVNESSYPLSNVNSIHSCNKIDPFTVNSSLICSASSGNNVDYLWHNRLGHVPFIKIWKISTIPANFPPKQPFICSICPMARQAKLPFPERTTSSTKILELLHVDLWGPYHIPIQDNYRNFLAIVDDFSRSTWTHLLSCKSNTFHAIKDFLSMIENQFGTSVKTIRSDNGLEFVNNETMTYFQEKGIVHQKICPYTPQQNGVVERKHKYLLETARALLYQSKLPIRTSIDCSIYDNDASISVTSRFVSDNAAPFSLPSSTIPNQNISHDFEPSSYEEAYMNPAWGFKHSASDYSLFYSKQGNSAVFVAVYVDDVILTGANLEEIKELKAFLHNQFRIKDLGKLHYLLGLEMLYKADGVLICERKFTMDLLKKYDCLTFFTVSSPLDFTIKLRSEEGTLLSNPGYYRKLVGKLNFLTNTRLDITYSVQHLSQFIQAPRETHLKDAIHVLR
ncbi:uncharacterized protein [Nicotiana tomentosiformis]|uniref:uncharacterized protein n=1 Tax=Nicotiana tomentosiformis TaxID=4098 RepID=UPI00388C5156